MIERFTEMELAAFACDQWGYLAPEYTISGNNFAELLENEGYKHGLPCFPKEIKDQMKIYNIAMAVRHWVDYVSYYQGEVDYRMASYIQNC